MICRCTFTGTYDLAEIKPCKIHTYIKELKLFNIVKSKNCSLVCSWLQIGVLYNTTKKILQWPVNDGDRYWLSSGVMATFRSKLCTAASVTLAASPETRRVQDCVSFTPVTSFTCTDLPNYWHSSRLRVWFKLGMRIICVCKLYVKFYCKI